MHFLSRILLPSLKKQSSKTAKSTQESSHELLLRAGFVRQSAAGLFTLLPFGLRVLKKIEKLIDEEMSKVGAQKIDMPCLLPAELWKKTGRWETGTETFKLKDRKSSQFLLGPTHEEEVTHLASTLIHSYRSLPLRLYQIGKKYRDELRPRGGLLRAKEFVMKDLYTFDESQETALETYDRVSEAYGNIFTKLDVPFAVADADTGSIGGTRSHEYHILSSIGEDTILRCDSCGFSSNNEKAETIMPIQDESTTRSTGENVITFSKNWMNEVPKLTSLLGRIQVSRPSTAFLARSSTSKSGNVDEITLLVVPADRTVNLIKLEKNGGLQDVFVDEKGTGLNLADISIDLVLVDQNCNPSKESNGNDIRVADIITAIDGDICPSCHNPTQASQSSLLSSKRAIEVGHTFYLGTKYSSPLDCTFKNSQGNQVPAEMGCYGIGVSRLIASIAEVSRDDNGFKWPLPIAPFQVCVILSLGKHSKMSNLEAAKVIGSDPCLARFEDVVYDDRDVSLGFKVNDALLAGYPYIIIAGKSFVETGKVDLMTRNDVVLRNK